MDRHDRTASAEPLVSVVIPTYNRAGYVGETIQSVLAQSYDQLEVIVIDDGSSDNTRQIVEEFGPKVTYAWQENSERGAARNHGLRLAKGDYIAFLDSDDLWEPTKVEQAAEFLRANPDVGLIYTDAEQIDGDGNHLRFLRAKGPSGKVTDELLRTNFVLFSTHVARTSVVREIGGFREDRQLSGSEDWEMLVRLSLRTDFAYLPGVTARIRTHPGNTMNDVAAMQRSTTWAADLLRRSPALASAHSRSMRRMGANIALGNAINYCTVGNREQSLDFLKQALAADARVALDPRFAYTIVRMLWNSLARR